MNWSVAKTYISDIQADTAKMALEGSGIPVSIKKDDCGGWRPYLQAITGVQQLVPTEDLDRALEILKETENG